MEDSLTCCMVRVLCHWMNKITWHRHLDVISARPNCVLCATVPYLSCACFASTLLLPSLRSLWQWTSLFLGWFSWQPEPHSNSNSNRVVAPFYLWINTGTARRTLEPRHFHWKFRFFCFALLILSSDGMIGCIWSLDCKSHRMRVKKKLVPFQFRPYYWYTQITCDVIDA